MSAHRAGARPGSVVVLTGSGISAESGVATFRGPGGLWDGRRVEEVATPEAFRADPGRVHDFYNARRARLSAVRPNAAHLALAEFEREHPGDFLLVTQNVDDLHERAGSRDPLHMHGELLKKRCADCGAVSRCEGALSVADACDKCGRAGALRPHIVWFGEMPMHLDDAIFPALAGCDLFVAVGTSGAVQPAGGFVAMARAAGAHCVEINLGETGITPLFDEVLPGPATETVPGYFGGLLPPGR